jgi:hypothetical protein
MTIYYDDLEDPGSGNWSHSAEIGPDVWIYHTQFDPLGGYATSGKDNLAGYNADVTSDSSVEMTSSVPVPPGAFLRFNHAFGFEDGGGAWDGGVVEYSTDDGATWVDAGPLFVDNGYTGTLLALTGNPLTGRDAFVRESNGYISSRVDLGSLSGQQVRFRFRIGTDGASGDYGWFIDDPRIYACDGGGK